MHAVTNQTLNLYPNQTTTKRNAIVKHSKYILSHVLRIKRNSYETMLSHRSYYFPLSITSAKEHGCSSKLHQLTLEHIV